MDESLKPEFHVAAPDAGHEVFLPAEALVEGDRLLVVRVHHERHDVKAVLASGRLGALHEQLSEPAALAPRIYRNRQDVVWPAPAIGQPFRQRLLTTTEQN